MKQNSWLLGILLFLSPLQMSAQKQDTVAVRETRIPVLIERQDNELFNLRIDATQSQVLNDVKLSFGKEVNLNEIEAELNDARFLRCHQSYLVNMNYVSEANDSFVLQNGDTVLIRAKSKRMILQKVLEYKEKTYRMRNYLSKHSMV